MFVTFHKRSCKSCFLNRPIRYKLDVQLIPRRLDIIRHFVSTKTTNFLGIWIATITNFNEIIDAIIVIFNLKWIEFPRGNKCVLQSAFTNFKGLEFKSHLKSHWHGNNPNTFFIWNVVFRVIRRLQLARFHIQFTSTHRCNSNSDFFGGLILVYCDDVSTYLHKQLRSLYVKESVQTSYMSKAFDCPWKWLALPAIDFHITSLKMMGLSGAEKKSMDERHFLMVTLWRLGRSLISKTQCSF